MQTKLAGWASRILTVVGVALVGAFFASWVRDGTTGLSIAWHADRWMFLVPASGLALAAASSRNSRYTRLASVAAGLVVAGDLLFDMMRGVLHGGVETWLVFGGAALVLAGVAESRRGLRAVGGIAVLAGFFAPWTSDSLFQALRHSDDLASAFGITLSVLWLIPIAGATAIASSMMSGPRGRGVAAISGLAVFGSMVWMLGSVANLVFAWGAWTTLAASACALALGVLAPSEKSAA